MATSVRSSIHQCICSVTCKRLAAARGAFPVVFAMAGIALFTVSVRASGPIATGDDAWVTPCGGGAYIDFSSTPIPAGFFDGISEPFGGTLELGGDPIVDPDISPAPASDIDTIVHRNATLATFVCGSSEDVDIQIKALSLISCSGITVRSTLDCADDADCPGGWICSAASRCESRWDVDICLAPAPQLLGSMTINHICQEGGTYSSTLPVNVQLNFTRSDLLSTAGPLLKSDTFESTGWWSHTDPGFGLTTLENGTDFFDCNGNLHNSENPLTPDFFPGIFLDSCVACAATANVGPGGPGDDCCNPQPGQVGCSDPVCQDCVCQQNPDCCDNTGLFGWSSDECASLACEACPNECICCGPPVTPQKPQLNPEQAQLAAHGVIAPNPKKPSGGNGGKVVTQACCKPAKSTLPCIDVTPSDCTDKYLGTPMGIGTNCANTDCGNPIYENWVIADDFCVECPKCSCDVNGDGICDTLDRLAVQDCVATGGAVVPPGADLNCNGYCDQGDVDILDCLFAGDPPDVCCGADSVRGPTIDRIEWFGSYLDPAFDPKLTDTPRFPDGWLIALHSDIPAQACPPPPDPKFTPVDFCGTLKNSPDGNCLLFNPKGSAFDYQILNPAALGTATKGDMIRICGYIDPQATSACVGGIAWIVVQSVLECGTEVSRPDRLIVQWAFPPALVETTNIGKVGWDMHPIYKYGTELSGGCLMHDRRSTAEIGPNGAFLPIPDRTYWISIQAEVGHRITRNADGTCDESPSGQIADRDFFGWHTTPPGYQRKDDAYMGQLLMGNPDTPCVDDWFYDWMGPLHCSDPRFKDCCDDPTKSIDMAFYLMGSRTGLCAGTTTPCTVDAECPAPGGCTGAGKVVHWCQPVNPGPPPPDDPPPPPTPTPEGGIDELSQTVAQLIGNLGKDTFDFELQGPTVIRRSSEQVSGIDPEPFIIETEILSMDLRSSSGVILRLDPDGLPSPGTIQRIDNFFDVFFELNLELSFPNIPDPLTVQVGMQARVFELPPCNATFTGPVKGPVPIVDAQGFEVGFLKSVTHFIPCKGGVNIHSDADWASVPTTDCCEPDPTTDTGCSLTLCPIDTEICLPFCVAPNVNGILEVNECDCIDPNKTCYAALDVNGNVECRGSCPPGQVCDGPNFVDTNADGMADAWKCACKGDPPRGACCIGGAGVTPQCIDNVTAAHCAGKSGVFHLGVACLGVEACCDPVTGACQDIDALCCPDTGGTAQGGGTVCGGSLEACCYPSGICTMEDPTCCAANGGTPLIGQACAGIIEACCDPNTGVCTMEDPTCCASHGGTPLPGVICFGSLEACCDPATGLCTMEDPACCTAHGGQALIGLVCSGVIEACCDNITGVCTMEDRTCCSTHGTSQGPNSDCANPGTCGPVECFVPAPGWCAANADTDCLSDDPTLACLPTKLTVNADGSLNIGLCDCFGAGGCGPISITDHGAGQIPQYTFVCEKACPDPNNENCWVHLDGVAQIGVIAIDSDQVGSKTVSCDCVAKETGACCYRNATGSICTDGVTQAHCDGFAGSTWHLNATCLGDEACCKQDGTCEVLDRLCCGDIAGATSLGPGSVCGGMLEACCDNNTGNCTMEDRACCELHGVSQPGANCATPGVCGEGICELPIDQIPVCEEVQLTACISDDPDTLCLANSVTVNNGIVLTDDCTCLIPDGFCGPVNVIGDPADPILSCEKDCPIVGQICLIHVNGFATTFTSIPAIQVTPGDQITCDCVVPPVDCQPNDDGSACEGVCPDGKACQPQVIKCVQGATPPCRIIECGCEQPGDDCHVEMPPVGANLPVCTGTCPPTLLPRKCVRRKVDSNGDGIKDAWDCRCVKKWAKPVLFDPAAPDSNRYLNGIVVPSPEGGVAGGDPLSSSSSTALLQAIRVTFDSLHHPDPPQDDPCPPPLPGDLCISPDFTAFEGDSMWVGAVHEFNQIQFPPTSFKGATLQCEPLFFDFSAEGAYSVLAAEVIPDSVYSLRVVDFDCEDSPEEPECWGEPLVLTTGRWGDVAEFFQGKGNPQQPTVNDIRAIVDNLKEVSGAPGKTYVQLEPNAPDPARNVNVVSLQVCIDAVKFFSYPLFGPCPCPPEVTCVFVECEAEPACNMNTSCCDTDSNCFGGLCTCQTNADCEPPNTCWEGICTSATDQCGRCDLP